MSKRALITGASGQVGSFMCEFLLSKGYQVFGLKRRSSTDSNQNIQHILKDIVLLEGDLTDLSSLNRVVKDAKPDEIYNFAAQSFVKASFEQPELTSNITGLGAMRLFEAARIYAKHARIYQAGTSEMFGSASPPQNENTLFHPRSPYGCAKAYAHHIAVNYREAYGMYVCNGMCFNHESPRRGVEFVTQKIARGAARCKQGLAKELRLGNLDAKRDWGHAKDYVRAQWLMLQQDKPSDYVVASGEAHTVKDFAKHAFLAVGLKWDDFVVVDKKFFRPTEVDYLCGDYKKARDVLGWKPEISFRNLVNEMVRHAMASDLSVDDESAQK